MRIQSMIPGILLLLGALVGVGALAQAPTVPQEKRELIYCADRMTHEEREAYRAKMRAAATLAEKDALRTAHRTEMQARARGQGVTDCEPPGRQWRGGRQP